MLKIAIVTPYGAEERLDHFAEFILAKGLDKLGYNVQFYTYKIKGEPLYRKDSVYQGIKVFRCRQRSGLSPGLFFSILKFKPRVVIFFHPKSFLSFTAYLAAKSVRAKIISEIVGILHDPYIVDDTDDPINNFKQNINLLTTWKKLFKAILAGRPLEQWNNFVRHMPISKADIIVAINEDEQKYIKRFYDRDSVLIYWCIKKNNGDKIKPSEDKYGPIPGEYLLFIAQIKKRKGWDTVIEALAVLKNQGIKKNLVFDCPATNVEEAKNYIEKLGIEDQVFFFCQVTNEEKNWLYDHAQYVLAPSRYEGFGLPVFEAFVAGKPLFGTDTPVYLEFLRHKENAMVSKTGSAQELAQNIKMLDNDPALANCLVLEGYKTAARFSGKVMIDKFVKLIEAAGSL